MLDQLTSAQLSEWEAYDRIDPVGTWRGDFQTAQILTLLTNMYNALHTKETKKVDVMEFMPNWTGEREEEKQQSLSEAIIQAFGGIARRQKKTKNQ